MTTNNDTDEPDEMNDAHKQLQEPPTGAVMGENDPGTVGDT